MLALCVVFLFMLLTKRSRASSANMIHITFHPQHPVSGMFKGIGSGYTSTLISQKLLQKVMTIKTYSVRSTAAVDNV